MITNCTCAEVFRETDPTHKERFWPGEFHQFHDCDYIRRRNALIPIAAIKASQSIGLEYNGKPNGPRWTKAFARYMDQLSALREASK